LLLFKLSLILHTLQQNNFTFIHSLQSALAAMSFDQYFEGAEQQQAQSSDGSDDWYGIVEQALYDADLASHRHKQRQS